MDLSNDVSGLVFLLGFLAADNGNAATAAAELLSGLNKRVLFCLRSIDGSDKDNDLLAGVSAACYTLKGFHMFLLL